MPDGLLWKNGIRDLSGRGSPDKDYRLSDGTKRAGEGHALRRMR